MRIRIRDIITIIELAAIVTAILFDLFLPTLFILTLMVVSQMISREHISLIGLKTPRSWVEMAGFTLITAIIMQLFAVGVLMPVMNRLTGETMNYSGLSSLEGNLGQLLTILVLSWTLAAIGEEMAYRGYLQKTISNLLGNSKASIVLVMIISSVLFGLAHTEQGLIGVVVTTSDALVFSWLKRRFDNNLWASILAHGFYNSIGVIVFYFTGPIYGLW